MKTKKWAIAACVAAAFVSAPAFATSSASASLTNFTVTLYSLNPLSTSAPTITFDTPVNAFVQTLAYDYSNAIYLNDSAAGFGSKSVNSGPSNAYAAATAVTDYASLTSKGSGSGAASGVYSYYQGESNATIGSFTLSANTVAVFTFSGSLSAKTTVGYDALTNHSEYASAWGVLQVSGSNGYSGSQSSNDQINLYSAYTSNWDPVTGKNIYAGENLAQNITLHASFVNSTNGNLSGGIRSYTQVAGHSNIAAVPEPETYGMLLAGLGLLGLIAKRRKAKLA